MMQHTEKHQFNLIETSDTFSPAALNENMEKLEAALAAKADAAGHDELERRVQVLELHKFVAGTYTGTGSNYGDTQFIDLGFTPTAVIVPNTSTSMVRMDSICVTGKPLGTLKTAPGGFVVSHLVNNNSTATANSKGATYAFLAFC